jgi:hypothetical protein
MNMARGSSVARAVSWLMLAVYVFVVSGVPLPFAGSPAATGSPAAKRLAGKDRSRPFPCMDKPCGCATAEQCLSSCCCNTPAELLAWAKANRVDPATLMALQQRAAAPRPAPAAGSCCSAAGAAPACCSATTPPAPAAEDVCAEYCSLAASSSCCEAMAAAAPQQPAADVPRDAVAVSGISLKAMLACGGILAGWSAATTSLPAPAAVCVERSTACCGRIALADDVGTSIDPTPDAPPPRA